MFTPLTYQKFPQADISTSLGYQNKSPRIQIHTRFCSETRMVVGFILNECKRKILYVQMNYLNRLRDARVRT